MSKKTSKKPTRTTATSRRRDTSPRRRPATADPVVVAICSALGLEHDIAAHAKAADQIARWATGEGLVSKIQKGTDIGLEIEDEGLAMVRRQWSDVNDDYCDEVQKVLAAQDFSEVTVDGGVLNSLLRRCVSAGVCVGVAIGCGMLRGGAGR
jgi:hypothetical protein